MGRFVFSPKLPNWLQDPYSMITGVLPRWQIGLGMKLTTPAPMIRMSGAIPLLPIHAFMA
jgi:hypothetical protein